MYSCESPNNIFVRARMFHYLLILLQVKKIFDNQKTEEEISKETAEGESIEIQVGELRQSLPPGMANTMSNMKMTNPIKGLVSKRRKRFTEDGFDLDLTCILLQLIIMFYVHIREDVRPTYR